MNQRQQFDRANPRIPAELVTRYYAGWAQRRGNPRNALAQALGVNSGRVKELLDDARTLSFSEVDRLLTIFDRNDVWHVEIAEYLEEAA